MNTQLPVPLAFRLPGPEWTAESPDTHGVANAAFLAIRHGLGSDYRPSIVVSGATRDDGASVSDIADESVLILAREAGGPVSVVERTSIDSEHSPCLVQRLRVIAEVAGEELDLEQIELVTLYLDQDASVQAARRAVVIHTLSCLASQTSQVEPEFRRYLESVHLEPSRG